MTNWSLVAEFLALILIVVIALYFNDRKQVLTDRRRIFQAGLQLAMLSVILNVVCLWTIEWYDRLPHWLNLILNSFYFLFCVWTSSIVAYYMFDLILEHVYDKRCRRQATVGLLALNLAFLLTVLANPWTGSLFWFDADGIYRRGPLNRLGYGILLAEGVMVTLCYLKNHSGADKNITRVMKTLPPITLCLAAVQLAFPDMLMNGTIAAYAVLILFVNFQTTQVEVDSLTKLGNRKSFFDELSLRVAGKQKFQILMVSLENFVAVNQRYGHRKGDEFIYMVSRWMEQYCREGRVCRSGSVTFALLLPYVSREAADENFLRIQRRFEEEWRLGEIRCRLPACLVELVKNREDWTAEQIIEFLERMMDMTKKGKLGSMRFSPKIQSEIQDRKKLIGLLRDSVEKQRFQVWYQPVYDCLRDEFCGAEALVRLQDADGEILSPGAFIPLAEETGMIDGIGWFMLENVCRFLAEHPELPLQSVSVNLSMQQFQDPQLEQRIFGILEQYGIGPERIKIEITERVIVSDMERVKMVMENLVGRGIGFYLDDFGTGYSNFSGVLHLPFECIKLDRSLFLTITENVRDYHVVDTMIKLFHQLGFSIVSEGLEREEQCAALRSMKTDRIQGYYYARPMPESEIMEFFR